MTCEIINDRPDSSSTGLRESSKPTLVLDAGMGNWSLVFYPMAEELRSFAKICLINRDGYLDKNSGSPRDIITVAGQMKAILELNNVKESIILVGHSLGGLHMRMFQHLFPELVAGLILLDAAHPRLYEELPQIKSNIAKQLQFVKMLQVMAKLQLLEFAKRSIPTFGLPPALHGKYYSITTKAQYYETYQSEMKYLEKNLALGKKLSGIGDLPLLVVSSPYGLNSRLNSSEKLKIFEDKRWFSLQRDFLNLSSNASFFKSNGDHFLHVTDTVAVSKAIQSFCEITQSNCSTKK